ncbi:MAG: hypothetical protein R3C03_12090 [Pirellulaceae bacterium]
MNIDKLVTEITCQLEDDVLDYAWMVQIARLQKPERSEKDWTNAVLDSVIKLHNDGSIVVGNAYQSDGMVQINPWPEENDALRKRMMSEIAKYNGSDDQAFCFWVQLSEHFAR